MGSQRVGHNWTHTHWNHLRLTRLWIHLFLTKTLSGKDYYYSQFIWGNWWICPKSRKWNQVFKLVKVSRSHSVVSNSLWPHRLYRPWNSPGLNTGVGSLSLFWGIFPAQGLNSGLLHCRQILYQLSPKGSWRILASEAYPFSSGSSRPRYQTGSPALQVDSLPTELSGKLLNIVLYCLSNDDGFFQLIGKKNFLLLANSKKLQYNNISLYFYKK